MHKMVWWLITLAGVGLFGLIGWNALRGPATAPELPEPLPPRVEAPPEPAVEPEIRHPVTERPLDKPLPALDTSDSSMRNAIAGLSGRSDILDALILQGFIRRVVATVDSLDGPRVATRILPLKRVEGAFAVDGGEGSYTMAPANAARYARYTGLMESVDARKLADLYLQYYPLFQQAYRELGYPKGHFNDRLVAVLDHLLAAPALTDPVGLLRPKVLFLYADPDLEARSAGQKILMRVGPANAARIKVWLREFRAAIAAQPAAAARRPPG